MTRCSVSQLISSETGLDPAGQYFKENRDRALENGDAKNVVALHTNINVYGFGALIGTNDKKVNGGERQPNCKVNVDFCSHNEAWNALSQYLRNKLVTEVDNRIHPYVICLDVSSSMDIDNRLLRAVIAIKKVIKKMKSGSYVGLVTFNENARIVQDILQIKGEEERNTLLESLPSKAYGTTSIGSGLRLSLNMLQAMQNNKTFCSTIVLLSDGENTEGETAEHVLPDLQNVCIAVSSIGLGTNAANVLEELSSATNGVVSYAAEDGIGNEIVATTRGFSYLFENNMEKPVRLVSKDIVLSDGESEVYFVIDDSTGNDTEFNIISYQIDKVDVRLTSPDGDEYSSNSEYFFNDQSTEKGFRIPYAEPGTWTLTVTKISKGKRSIRSTLHVMAEVTTHQLNDKPAIQLAATLSDRVLQYPKPVTVEAQLQIDDFPIIYAEVFANIVAPNQNVIRLPLHDNGVFPDELANDGIYTNNIITLPNPERYTVIVTALAKNTTLLAPIKINYFKKEVIDCEQIACKKVGQFEREEEVGSIKLKSQENRDEIPPPSVSDLHGFVENEEEKIISLVWTSVSDLFDIKIKHYDIRALINDTDFELGLKFNDRDIVKGSLNATNSTDEIRKISIRIPKQVWDYVVQKTASQYLSEMKFALKSVGVTDMVSEVSNSAAVTIKIKQNTTTVAITQNTVAVSEVAINNERKVKQNSKIIPSLVFLVLFYAKYMY